MNNKIRLAYLDEESTWQSTAYYSLRNEFEMMIPENLPQDINKIWDELLEFAPQVILVDYRLNETGILSYTGDEVIGNLRKHNKHLPMFIITSYEDNAITESKIAEVIRGKELFTDKKEILVSMIHAAANKYDNKKYKAEAIIQELELKQQKGEKLSDKEAVLKFNAELYLSELDLDSNVRMDLITKKSNDQISEMLKLTREIINLHKKE